MKALLDTDDPIYVQRLAARLNSLPDGFFLYDASYVRDKIRHHSAKAEGSLLSFIPCGCMTPKVVSPNDVRFLDSQGNGIIASRSRL
jgi:hypothetical protein